MFSNWDFSGWRVRRTGLTPVWLPRAWDAETLLRSIAWLRFENRRGRNIYIRPQGEHHLSLVDDLSKSAIGRIKAEGLSTASSIITRFIVLTAKIGSSGSTTIWFRTATSLISF